MTRRTVFWVIAVGILMSVAYRAGALWAEERRFSSTLGSAAGSFSNYSSGSGTSQTTYTSYTSSTVVGATSATASAVSKSVLSSTRSWFL